MMYSTDQLIAIDAERVPQHIAIIMDGNRRWARRQGLPVIAGHWKGASALTKIVRAASDLGVKVLTVYAFSTENWNRDPIEVEALMGVLKHYLIAQKASMQKEGVRLQTIGSIDQMPLDVQRVLQETKRETDTGKTIIDLVLALNYGGRDDIRRAFLAMMSDCQTGKLSQSAISESVISQYLDTAPWPDPELLIRTSGERRQSNFLLWQLSYSEFYHADVLWPDFDELVLLEIVKEYQKRNRRLGV